MIKFKEGYKYQLVENYTIYVGIFPEKEINIQFIDLTTDGYLTIYSGYAWDGPSGPAIDTKNFMRASLVHDALYQLMRMRLIDRHIYRKQADCIMKKITKETGMWKIRRWWCFRAVRRMAASAANPKNRRPILTAP